VTDATTATSSSPADQAWQALTAHMLEIMDLDGIDGVLGWDQHVWMPGAGAEYRGRQSALISRLRHERMSDPVVGDWLTVLTEDDASMADPVRAAAVRNLGRTTARLKKIPASLVEAQAKANTVAFGAWLEAREQDAVGPFLPALSEVVRLAREEARCVADGRPLYDGLVEPHDPGVDTAALSALFDRLVPGLQALLDQIPTDGDTPAPLAVSVDAQRRIHRRVVQALGFDLDRGRLDESPHPFTMGIGPRDVRLTTRYNADDLLAGLLGTVHEAGHGMYEQGVPEDLRGTSVGQAASTGLHESQSRFWENVVGRSRPFMGWLSGIIAEETGQDVSADALLAQANHVRRSLIRVEADEVTYNLHIALRFQLERDLIEGRLQVDDIADAWDDTCEAFLGLRPPSARQGVLQDVHWSTGLLGYFPSYTLGNVYAGALTSAVQAALPGMWTDVAAGRFEGILGWLREHVHSRGHLVDAPELVAQVTGGADPVDSLLAHLRQRHG